jgi:hypothetical protein
VQFSSHGGIEQAIRITRERVANPEIPAIFEAALENARRKIAAAQRARWEKVRAGKKAA